MLYSSPIRYCEAGIEAWLTDQAASSPRTCGRLASNYALLRVTVSLPQIFVRRGEPIRSPSSRSRPPAGGEDILAITEKRGLEEREPLLNQRPGRER